MTERPINLHAHEVRAALAGNLGLIVRPVKPQPQKYTGGCYPPDRKPKHPAPYIDAYCGEKKTPANPRGMGRVWCWWTEDDRMGPVIGRCPFGVPGDKLWGRETWQKSGIGWGNKLPAGKVHYRATDSGQWKPEWGGWRPSTQMPRWASRITLEIATLAVKQVAKITEAEAMACGFERLVISPREIDGIAVHPMTGEYVDAFKAFWQRQYGDAQWAWFCSVKGAE